MPSSQSAADSTASSSSQLHCSNLFSVQGKVALVTGGGKGIGRMISRALMANGIRRLYIVSRDLKVLEQTAKELNDEFHPDSRCIALQCDVSKRDDLYRLVKEVLTQPPYSEHELHILVNNSGAQWAEDLSTYGESAFDKLMRVNLYSVFFATQALLPLLEAAAAAAAAADKSDPSRVINIGSIHGVGVPMFDTFAYSASKAAVHHLGKHLASKLASRGITVNTLACGMFRSKMTAATIDKLGDRIVKDTPMGRIGDESDIGGAVLYLCSKAGSWVTGTVLPIDGGVTIKARY